MTVVAGPIASGKTELCFRVLQSQVDSFNVDDRCAELNGGSYQDLPPSVVAQATRECEQFIAAHVAQGRSFMVETTLRTAIAIDQAARARAAGFFVEMAFLGTEDPEINVRRAEAREFNNGRNVSPDMVREVYARSMENLARALREFDRVVVYDNSPTLEPASTQAEVWRGRVVAHANPIRWWVWQRLVDAGVVEQT